MQHHVRNLCATFLISSAFAIACSAGGGGGGLVPDAGLGGGKDAGVGGFGGSGSFASSPTAPAAPDPASNWGSVLRTCVSVWLPGDRSG